MHLEAPARKYSVGCCFAFFFSLGKLEILEIKREWMKLTTWHQLMNLHLSIWNVILLLTQINIYTEDIRISHSSKRISASANRGEEKYLEMHEEKKQQTSLYC